jgi:glycosyltransferase involved in cell wall biosynthesis
MWYLIRRRKKYDAVLCVPCAYLTDLLPGYVAGLITKIPYVIRTTTIDNFDFLLSKTAKSTEEYVKKMLIPPFFWFSVFNEAAAVVTQSEVIRDKAELYGVTNCKVIPNGTDTKRFSVASGEERLKLRRNLKLPEDKIIVITTGRYVAEKNQTVLIKAAEHIEINLRPHKLCVLILGATERKQITSNEAELKRYAIEQNLDGLVRFFDNVANVEDFLNASDIFVLSSHTEGLPNSLLEAMSCGLPCICSDLPQVTCIFPDVGGFFFSPSDVGKLALHLTDLIDSKELRKFSGAALAAHARHHYSIVRAAERYATLLNRITTNT